jgi:hypothetical protein
MAKPTGGGIQSKQNVKVGVRTGARATALNPAYPSQIGAKFGNHAERGDTPKTGQVKPSVGAASPSVPLGNALATNVGKGGPGNGREVYSRGSQGQHGPVAPGSSPSPRDILSEYGPEKSKG